MLVKIAEISSAKKPRFRHCACRERGGRSRSRRADGKIDENDAVAVRFDDPSEIGKGKKYRGGIIVRVNADRRQ